MLYSLDTRLQFDVCKTTFGRLKAQVKAPGDGAFSFRKEMEHGCKSSSRAKKSFGGSLPVCQSAKKNELFL